MDIESHIASEIRASAASKGLKGREVVSLGARCRETLGRLRHGVLAHTVPLDVRRELEGRGLVSEHTAGQLCATSRAAGYVTDPGTFLPERDYTVTRTPYMFMVRGVDPCPGVSVTDEDGRTWVPSPAEQAELFAGRDVMGRAILASMELDE